MTVQAAVQQAPPVPPIVVTGTIRRFELPDIDRHGSWMMRRLIMAYPHLTERTAIGWLRNILYQNEFLFLYQDHSVALAQAVRPDALTPRTSIWEKFVWAQDPKNAEHQAEAALFYDHFLKWAGHQDAELIVVEEQSDVPHDLIKAALGKLLERRQIYARL
jgi:hypothetical protein